MVLNKRAIDVFNGLYPLQFNDTSAKRNSLLDLVLAPNPNAIFEIQFHPGMNGHKIVMKYLQVHSPLNEEQNPSQDILPI